MVRISMDLCLGSQQVGPCIDHLALCCPLPVLQFSSTPPFCVHLDLLDLQEGSPYLLEVFLQWPLFCSESLVSKAAWYGMDNRPKAENGKNMAPAKKSKENGPRPEMGENNDPTSHYSPISCASFSPFWAVGHLFFGPVFSLFRLSAHFPFYARPPESQ